MVGLTADRRAGASRSVRRTDVLETIVLADANRQLAENLIEHCPMGLLIRAGRQRAGYLEGRLARGDRVLAQAHAEDLGKEWLGKSCRAIGPPPKVDERWPILADLSPTRTDELHLVHSDSHSGNWLDCIATRLRPVMDVEIGHRVTCWSHLCNITYLTGRKLRWDPAAERFLDDDQANRMLHAPYREPWRL